MSNLIVTIISIVLIAIAAIMGLYYGGLAYQNSQVDAIATAIIGESQQILAAQRIWATNKNQPDATGAGFSVLVSSNALTQWPPLAANQLGTGPTPSNGSFTTGQMDATCYNLQGYTGSFIRRPFTYNNANYIAYLFISNINNSSPCTTQNGTFVNSDSDVSQINHPIVKIARAINKKVGVPPGILIDAVGLARPTVGGFPILNQPSGASWFSTSPGTPTGAADTNGSIIANYCYAIAANTPYIVCEFGPS